MQHAARAVAAQKLHRIAVRLTVVDDDRQIVRRGQFHLRREGFVLRFSGGVLLPVVVQANLPHGHHLRAGQQGFHLLQPIGGRVEEIAGMHADGGIHVGPALRKGDALIAALQARTAIDDGAHALLRQGGKQLLAVFTESVRIVMRVGIKNLHELLLSSGRSPAPSKKAGDRPPRPF